MGYFLAPSLVTLRSQINARWPARDKGSDGWIGDASHQARKSDHNPDYDDGGIVRAIDVDKDGIDVNWLLAVATTDYRTSYVIWQGRIWQRPTGRWSTYTGANRHDHHVHISVRSGGPDRDPRPWGAGLVSNPVTGGGSVPTAPGVTPPAPIVPEEDIVASLEQLRAELAPLLSAIADVGDRIAFRIENTDGAYLDCGGVRRGLSAAEQAVIGATITAIPASAPFWTIPLVGKHVQAFQRATPLAGEEPGSLYYVEDGQLVHVTPERYALDLKPPIKVVPNTAGLWSLPTKAAA